MKNIGTKSINMSDIMVYLAMFSTIIDKILWFWVTIFDFLISGGGGIFGGGEMFFMLSFSEPQPKTPSILKFKGMMAQWMGVGKMKGKYHI